MGIVLNYCQYGVLYLGSYYNTGPYISFPRFGNSNLGKLPYRRICRGLLREFRLWLIAAVCKDSRGICDCRVTGLLLRNLN